MTTTTTTTDKRHRVLSAWNSGEASASEISKSFQVSSTTVRQWIEEAFAAGETTRPPRQKSTRATRSGRLL